MDDLEVRGRRHPVRRRQGRRHRRSRRSSSQKELEALTRRFFTEIEVLVGPEKDIPAPDVNTNAQIMAWMMDTYSMHAGYTVPGVVTGKPISLGGSEGRNEATARGTVFCIVEAARHLGHRARQGQGRDPGLRQRRLDRGAR